MVTLSVASSHVFNLSSGALLSQAFPGRTTGRVPTHVLPQLAPSPATMMLGPRTHKRYPELKQNTHSSYADRPTHTRWMQGRGTGKWHRPAEDSWRHHGMSVLRGWQWHCREHAHLPLPPQLVSNQDSSLASVWEQALNFKRCSTLSLPGRRLRVARPVWVPGPPGTAPQENRQAQACGTREQACGECSYTIPSGLSRAGDLKGPWKLPGPDAWARKPQPETPGFLKAGFFRGLFHSGCLSDSVIPLRPEGLPTRWVRNHRLPETQLGWCPHCPLSMGRIF